MNSVNFTSQFNKCQQVLNSFAYTLTQNQEDAKDLFQETAYRAFKNFEKYQPDTNLKAWLMTIMKNIFINNYRRKTKNPVILDDTKENYFINSSKHRTVNNGGASSMMVDELTSIINELEDGFRIPFLMHFQGYKYHEIADVFGLPLGTIKSRIFFARRDLKAKINARYNQPDTISKK